MGWFGKKRHPQAWKGLASGLAGGIAGTVVMTFSQQAMGRWMGKQNKESEEEAAGEAATVQVARHLSKRVLHRDLGEEERNRAGQVVHFGYGTVLGALYGTAAEYWPATTRGMGLPFGAGAMLAGDEIAVPALHLSPPPNQVPAATHLYALASHLVYGLSCEAARRGIRRLLH